MTGAVQNATLPHLYQKRSRQNNTMATERKRTKRTTGKPAGKKENTTRTNPYDDDRFLSEYSGMSRSVNGLSGAGEWHVLEKMLPDFCGKRVLDLGCGYGWHCRYAIEHGAIACTGIDTSEKMLKQAHRQNASFWTEYRCMAIEDFEFEPETYDVVISSLAFHYIESFGDLYTRIYRSLTPGGAFVFSIEHPVYTASGSQQWITDENGKKLHWPVDRYFDEGKRDAIFLGQHVTKYHRTLTTVINGVIAAGFILTGLAEPEPEKALLETVPGMIDETRRPAMLIVSAIKNR